MDFSRGWVKPGTVVTEPQAKVRLELARLERREQGLQERLPVPAFRA